MTATMSCHVERLVGAVAISDHEELRVFVYFNEGVARNVSIRPYAHGETGIRELDVTPDWKKRRPAELPQMHNIARRTSIPIERLAELQGLLSKAYALANIYSKESAPYAED